MSWTNALNALELNGSLSGEKYSIGGEKRREGRRMWGDRMLRKGKDSEGKESDILIDGAIEGG